MNFFGFIAWRLRNDELASNVFLPTLNAQEKPGWVVQKAQSVLSWQPQSMKHQAICPLYIANQFDFQNYDLFKKFQTYCLA